MAYTDVAHVKAYLGITSTSEDDVIASLISAAQAAIDADRGYSFEATADTTRRFVVGVDTARRTLYLDTWLAQITSVITDADAVSPVTLATTEYITSPRNVTPYHAIELLASSANSWTYTTNAQAGVTVTGRWAWSVTCPSDIEQACRRLASYFYRQKDAGVFDTTAIPDAGIIQVPQGIPRDVQIILNNYPKGYGG